MSAALDLRRADPASDQVRPVVLAHLAHSRAESPDTSCHTMSVEELSADGMAFWALFEGEAAIGCGALKPLGDGLVEVKSVHVLNQARGRGLARLIMQRLIEVAREDGHGAMVLETGSHVLPGYDAARALYEKLGFDYVDVIPSYQRDPNSAFMRLDLAG